MNWFLFFDVIAWVVAIFGGLLTLRHLLGKEHILYVPIAISVLIAIAYLIARL